jgi:hypothetical protein
MRQDEAERIEEQQGFEPDVVDDGDPPGWDNGESPRDERATWTCTLCEVVNSVLDGECQFCDDACKNCGGAADHISRADGSEAYECRRCGHETPSEVQSCGRQLPDGGWCHLAAGHGGECVPLGTDGEVR